MTWALVRVTQPAEEPVTLEEAKIHLRVDATDEDALISSLIVSAREHVEGFQGRSLVTQTWRLSLDRFPRGRVIRLPRPPLQSVTSITYIDPDGNQQMLAPGAYDVDADSEPGRVVLKDSAGWPDTADMPSAVLITYEAGYGSARAVPQAVKQAMLLLIGHWHANRETAVVGSTTHELSFAVKALLWPDRVFPFHPAGEDT